MRGHVLIFTAQKIFGIDNVRQRLDGDEEVAESEFVVMLVQKVHKFCHDLLISQESDEPELTNLVDAGTKPVEVVKHERFLAQVNVLGVLHVGFGEDASNISHEYRQIGGLNSFDVLPGVSKEEAHSFFECVQESRRIVVEFVSTLLDVLSRFDEIAQAQIQFPFFHQESKCQLFAFPHRASPICNSGFRLADFGNAATKSGHRNPLLRQDGRCGDEVQLRVEIVGQPRRQSNQLVDVILFLIRLAAASHSLFSRAR